MVDLLDKPMLGEQIEPCFSGGTRLFGERVGGGQRSIVEVVLKVPATHPGETEECSVLVMLTNCGGTADFTSKHQGSLPRCVCGHGAVPGGMAVEYEDGARFSGSEPVGVDELNKALLGGRLVFNDWGGISTFDAIKTYLRKPLFTVDLERENPLIPCKAVAAGAYVSASATYDLGNMGRAPVPVFQDDF